MGYILGPIFLVSGPNSAKFRGADQMEFSPLADLTMFGGSNLLKKIGWNYPSGALCLLPNIKFSYEFKFPTRRIFWCFFIILLKKLLTYFEKIEFYFCDKSAHMVHISKAIALLTYFWGCFTFMVFCITNVSLKILWKKHWVTD